MWEVVCDKNGSYTLLLSFIFRIYSFFYQRMVAVKMGKINQDTGVTKCLHFFGDFFFFFTVLKGGLTDWKTAVSIQDSVWSM